jgi:DNA-binding MarR family transcriptional regulator
MERRPAVDSVVRALRRVNFQGSIFGQSVAIRLGLSESDIDALELLIDTGAATAGRLSEVMGLTSGAVTRVIDRLEQAGYVRRRTDPADRRRVIIEVVPERIATVESLLDSLEQAFAKEAGRYSPDELETINAFLTRMADLTQTEAARLRTTPDASPGSDAGVAEYTAPRGGITEASLLFRSGMQELRIRPHRSPTELYRGRFDGATPQVRVRDGRVLVGFRSSLFDWRKRVATMALSVELPWAIEIVGGIQRVEADLRAISLRRLELTGGTERVQVELGPPDGEIPVRIVGGAKTIRIEHPSDAPLRLRVRGGASQVELDGQVLGKMGGDISVDSRGWAGSTDRYAVEVVGGAKTVTVVDRPD